MVVLKTSLKTIPVKVEAVSEAVKWTVLTILCICVFEGRVAHANEDQGPDHALRVAGAQGTCSTHHSINHNESVSRNLMCTHAS